MRRAYQSDDEIGMIPREMAQGLRDLVGRAMVDPDFLVALQRSPNALLADYELTADERATILQALASLPKTSAGQPRHEFRNALLRRVATYALGARPVRAPPVLHRFLRHARLFTRVAGPDLIVLA